MSSDLNIITMNGRVVKNAEIKTLSTGTCLLTFTVASNRSYKKGDEWQNDTCFIDCKMWGKYGESLHSKLLKGVYVSLSGRLDQESWDTDNGKRSRHVITASSVQVLNVVKNNKESDLLNSGTQVDNAPEIDNNPFDDNGVPF